MSTQVLNSSFGVANSVLNGINKFPSQFTGGDGATTGKEVLFDVTFNKALLLPADHYFFVPQVEVTGGDFLWLSAPRPIVAPGTGFSPDLQTWIRNENLDPDWLRVGTDITGQGPFNAAFSLSGQAVPEPSSLVMLASGGFLALGLRWSINGNLLPKPAGPVTPHARSSPGPRRGTSAVRGPACKRSARLASSRIHRTTSQPPARSLAYFRRWAFRFAESFGGHPGPCGSCKTQLAAAAGASRNAPTRSSPGDIQCRRWRRLRRASKDPSWSFMPSRMDSGEEVPGPASGHHPPGGAGTGSAGRHLLLWGSRPRWVPSLLSG